MAYKSPNSKVTGFFSPIKEAVKAGAQAAKNAEQRVAKKVVGIASDVMSAPARMKAGMAARQADRDVKTLKRARAYDNAPNFNEDGSVTDAFKARTMADEVRMRRAPKK